MLPITSAGAAQTAPCSSISPILGRRCTRVAGHDGDHRSGHILWPSGESAPAAPAAPAAPCVSPARETVLRLAAALLPGSLSYRCAPLSELAAQFKELRATWHYDIETAHSLDSWLAMYRGEP